jgi:hypothetical protein
MCLVIPEMRFTNNISCVVWFPKVTQFPAKENTALLESAVSLVKLGLTG